VRIDAVKAEGMSRRREEDAAEGVYFLHTDGRDVLATRNLTPGISFYGERLMKTEAGELREWEPNRSKLAAAILNGLKQLPVRRGSRVLYLGASTGTTVSHVSDIVGEEGVVFAVEVSHRVARELVENVVKRRKNVIPILEDARYPERYGAVFGRIDVVYCDIAQSDQTEIAIANVRHFVRPGGSLLLVVKARSIDVLREPKQVVREEAGRLQDSGFSVEQVLYLDPFDRDHGMISAVYGKS
jgi:fibrillarin-like pre-rRNA processing protein